jgi:hypothetical protein
MNKQSELFYAAHGYDPHVLTCRTSKHVPILSICCRFCIAHFLSQGGTCAWTLKTYKDQQRCTSMNIQAKLRLQAKIRRDMRSCWCAKILADVCRASKERILLGGSDSCLCSPAAEWPSDQDPPRVNKSFQASLAKLATYPNLCVYVCISVCMTYCVGMIAPIFAYTWEHDCTHVWMYAWAWLHPCVHICRGHVCAFVRIQAWQHTHGQDRAHVCIYAGGMISHLCACTRGHVHKRGCIHAWARLSLCTYKRAHDHAFACIYTWAWLSLCVHIHMGMIMPMFA